MNLHFISLVLAIQTLSPFARLQMELWQQILQTVIKQQWMVSIMN